MPAAQSSLSAWARPKAQKAGEVVDLTGEDSDEAPRPSKRARLDGPTASTSASASASTSSAVASTSQSTAPTIGPFTLELDARKRFVVAAPTFDISTTFSAPDYPGEEIRKSSGLDLLFYKAFLVAPGRQELFQYLLDALPWYKVRYQTRGMEITTPRWTSVYGIDSTDGVAPATSAQLGSYQRRPRVIPPVLAALKAEVEQRTGARFNFCLVNLYQDGKDSITYHSDGESFLGPLPTIASLSLGAPRDFLMRAKERKSTDQPLKWTLRSGDMVVMRGTTQSTWEHSVPKRASAGPRINITFRRAINKAGTDNYYRYNVHDGPMHRWIDGKMVQQT